MPLYAFVCEACGHQFDRLQKIADPDPSVCPQCSAPTPRRQITAAAVRLRGTGWYETDFKPADKRRHVADGGDGPSAKK